MAGSGEQWTVKEKRKLARLLSIYPLDAYENISQHLPKKSREEVKAYVKKMIHSTQMFKKLRKDKYRKSGTEDSGKAPLEVWLEVASSLVENEQFDFSTCLSKVMSFISNFEEFPDGDVGGHAQPDYKLIYKYLSQVFQGDRREDVEELEPLESAVVLDLVHSLMEVLSDSDLTVQYNVMRWKYLLMNERDQVGHPIPELLRQANENDFTEFCKWRESFFRKEDNTDTNYVVVDEEQPEKILKVVAHYTYDSNYSTGKQPKNKNPNYINSNVYRNKPGRKARDAQEPTAVTEIVRVLPPKNCKIIKTKTRAKKRTLRDDGKYFGINHSENIHFADKVEDKPDNDEVKDTSAVTHNVETESYRAWQGRKTQYEEMFKKREGKREVKKPRLYSLNPFCLPISLLDLESNS